YPRLGLTSEWDTGAAQCVVEEAGGLLNNAETLQRLQYNSKDSLLNPFFLVIGDDSRDWGQYL
ncbi:MAG: 3'(2'),5'-bisphosphate nucleotidase CysQ, partial [Gammaproteobacteria bacterium]